MVSSKKNFFKFIAMFIQKKYLLFFVPITFLFIFTVVVYPEEILIPGDKKLEEGFFELSNENKARMIVTDFFMQ